MRFTDKRRVHRHFKATVVYKDGAKFSRVYLDLDKAKGFTARQRKSPIVVRTHVDEINKGRA